MFEITILNTVLYFIFLGASYYFFICLLKKRFLKADIKKLSYTILVFTLLGAIGEDFVNTIYPMVFTEPLWEYKIFPTHDANISYLFPMIWGTLGFYTYFRNEVFGIRTNSLWSGLILGVEAIFAELIANVPFHYLFGEYIFYYLPANLGFFSHFSCLQVIPFYIIVGSVTSKMIMQQEKMNYLHFRTTVLFYLMIMVTFVYI